MPEDRPPIAAIILAAGASSRMGRPKALLPLGGRTCLERVIGTCRGAGLSPIHVVVGSRGGLLAAACASESPGAHPRATAVWNDRFPEGQVTSLQAGIRSLPPNTAGALLFAVDHPLVRAETVQRLARAFSDEREGRRVFLPVYAGRPGRPYLVERSMFAALLAVPPGEPGRPAALRDPALVREIPVDDPGIHLDLDTPDDYRRLRDLMRGTP